MSTFLQDLRLAARVLARDPVFSIAALATLALALGANTAIFSLSHAVLLRALPYSDPARIMVVANAPLAFGPGGGFAISRRMRESMALESSALYYASGGVNFAGRPAARRLNVAQVSASFLRTLGSSPLLGRDFADADAAAGANRVVLMAEAIWRSQFAADPAVIGRTVRLNGLAYQVVGVMPERFEFPAGAQLWVPLPVTWEFIGGSAAAPDVIARLKPGVDRQTAERQLERAITADRPRDPGEAGLTLQPLQDRLTEGVRVPLLVLLAAVTLVLLIGCVNLSGLLLARVSSRVREFAVRGALGASAADIRRQLFAEALLLVLLGGAAALLLVFWSLDAIVALFPAGVLPTTRIAPSGVVLAYTSGVAILAALLCTMIPAVHAARASRSVPRGEGVGPDAGRVRLRSIMLVAEVALSVVLVTAAGLLARSLIRLHDVPLGFRPEHTLTLRLRLPEARYGEASQITAFASRALERLRALPGVSAAAIGDDVPLSSELSGAFRVGLPGETREVVMAESGRERSSQLRAVTRDYFRALGMTLLAGEDFAETAAGGERTFVINDRLARMLFPGGNAVGQRVVVWYGPANPRAGTVAGVVRGVRAHRVEQEPTAQLWALFGQAPTGNLVIVLRLAEDRSRTLAAVRAALHELDAELPPFDVRSLQSVVSASLGSRQGVTIVMAAFAALALALSAVGLYGVIAQSVAQRRREIGVRLALGARRESMLRLVLRRGLGFTLPGIALGMAGAVATMRVLRSLLFEVGPQDPVTLLGVPVLMLLVALSACLLPALRATRVDPLVAMRES
jgi:putative ABC transport system permease protein